MTHVAVQNSLEEWMPKILNYNRTSEKFYRNEVNDSREDSRISKPAPPPPPPEQEMEMYQTGIEGESQTPTYGYRPKASAAPPPPPPPNQEMEMYQTGIEGESQLATYGYRPVSPAPANFLSGNAPPPPPAPPPRFSDRAPNHRGGAFAFLGLGLWFLTPG
jgi:hypothetical protein